MGRIKEMGRNTEGDWKEYGEDGQEQGQKMSKNKVDMSMNKVDMGRNKGEGGDASPLIVQLVELTMASQL